MIVHVDTHVSNKQIWTHLAVIIH